MPANRFTIFPTPSVRSRRLKGFTLTEVAIVLLVISLILAGVWTAAGIVNEKSRVTQAVTQLNLVAQNMTSMLQAGYGVSNTPCVPAPCNKTSTFLTSGIIPQQFDYDAGMTKATNPWNPTGFVVSWMSAAGAVPTYRMSFYGVTMLGCVNLIMQATNCTPGQPGCPITVNTGGTQPAVGKFSTPPGNAYDLTGGEIGSTDAQNLCDPAACPATPTCNTYPTFPMVGTVNSVEFDFTQ